MDTFINNTIKTWGDDGKIWLDRLAEIINLLSEKWHLTEVLALPNLNYAFVATAKMQDKPVVLKISYDSIELEYKALKINNGCGMVSVLDAELSLNAMLLERIQPGISLKEYSTQYILQKISIFADVVENISKIQYQEKNIFPHVSAWCADLNTKHSQLINNKIINMARKLADHLLETSNTEYLCHGDLHLNNILQKQNSWVAIDPKGVIAEKEFEVAAFDLLSAAELAKQVNLAKRISARNHSLATKFNFNPQRLLAWTFVRLIIGAVWHLEDSGDLSNNIFLAEQIFPLIIEKQLK